MIYPRKNLDSKEIKLKNIYSNLDVDFNIKTLDSKKIKEIYGDVFFPKISNDKPYLYASFVSSIDGKITFKDIPNGTLISKNNKKDPKGGLADFWIMNMLRSLSDAIFIGSGTLRDEANATGHIFDEELEKDRIKAGLPAVPINIIVSKTARTIPFDHKIFNSKIPLILITSQEGARYAKYYSQVDTYELKTYSTIEKIEDHKKEILDDYKNNKDKLIIISTYLKDDIDNKIIMKTLKILGLNYISVEASYYTHALIKEKLCDEIFLNYSGIYIGGNAIGIANTDDPFSSYDFPHMEMLSIHIHSPFFMYTRQKFIYD